MKNTKIIFVLLLFIIGFIGCTKIGKNVTIKGRVINPVNNEPIAEKKVYLYRNNFKTIKRTNTNEKRTDEKQLLQAYLNKTENETHQKTVLKVYPNPSDKGFTIEFPESEGSYIITDTNGKTIKENGVLSQTVFIELPKGIYFLKWMSSNGVQTKKIIAL